MFLFFFFHSHGRFKEMVHYASLNEDWERVINASINAREFKQALKVLQRQTSEELFYRFSPLLMHEVKRARGGLNLFILS